MPTVEDAISGYIKLRDKKKEIKKRHQDELAPINAKMMMIENWLMGELNRAGVDNMRKKGIGTVFLSNRTSAKVTSWEDVLTFIRENELWHMLEHRVGKSAVDEYIEANGEPPPGVEISVERTVNIRR